MLLRSAGDAHPNGLANGSDVVGRHYMCHNNSAMLALSTTPNPTQFQKTLGLNDYYFGAEDYDYPLGHLQMLGKTQPEMFVGETHGLVPNMALEKLALHSLDFWATTEDLPLPEAEQGRLVQDRQGRIILNVARDGQVIAAGEHLQIGALHPPGAGLQGVGAGGPEGFQRADVALESGDAVGKVTLVRER